MIATLVLAAVLGSNDVVVADSAKPKLLQMMKSSLDPKAVDLSSTYHLLFSQDGLMFNDFHGFTQASPPNWPASLENDWVRSMAHCKAVMGPIPVKSTRLAGAMCCSKRLAGSLWEALLTTLSATRVVVTWEERTESNQCVRIFERSSPNDAIVYHASEPCDGSGATALKTVLEMTDSAQTRERSTPVWREPDVDPLANEKPSATPLTPKATCAELPAKLAVTGAWSDSVLARSLTSRWSPTSPKSQAVLSCQLFQSTHSEPRPNDLLSPAFTAVLTCGKTDVVVERTLTTGKRKALEEAAAKLSEELASSVCAKK